MKIFFLIKKLVGSLVMPLQFSLALIVLGIVLLWLNRRRRLALGLVIAGTVLLLVFSNTFVGYHAVRHLEARYPPLRMDLAEKTAGFNSQLGPEPLIVVLSGGASDDRELPVTDRLTSSSALRVVAAVQIYRRIRSSLARAPNPGELASREKQSAAATPRILMSGGPTLNRMAEAVPMERLAESLGIPATAILMETHSDDTASEARDVLPLAGHKPFILVTSAYHMPRAMALFQHLGMRPIAAPCDYEGRWNTKAFFLDLIPAANALLQCETAWHEQLGMIWERLRGQA